MTAAVVTVAAGVLTADPDRIAATIEEFGPPERYDVVTGMPAVYPSTSTKIHGRRIHGSGYATFPGFYLIENGRPYDLRAPPPRECFKCPGNKHWSQDCRPRAMRGAAYYGLPL